jgi:hypothetical protein
MNTTVHPYPGVNGTLDANNEQNGVVHICDHEKPVLTIAVNYRQSDTLIPRSFSVNFCGVSGKTPIAEDCNRRPAQVIRSWNELLSGYGKKAEDALITQFHANTMKWRFFATSNSISLQSDRKASGR